MADDTLRQSGRVKWFNASKGYGFITPDDDGSVDDLYFHQTAIQMDGFRVLDEGDPVTFVVGPGPKGLQATDVRLNSDLHSA
jgi:cold shock protein